MILKYYLLFCLVLYILLWIKTAEIGEKLIKDKGLEKNKFKLTWSWLNGNIKIIMMCLIPLLNVGVVLVAWFYNEKKLTNEIWRKIEEDK